MRYNLRDFRAYLTIMLLGSILYLGYFFTHLPPSGGQHLPPAPSGFIWKETFRDEFNGRSLNPNLWTTCYDWYSSEYKGCTNGGNFELEWYQASQVRQAGGLAAMIAIPKRTPGWSGKYTMTYPYISGMLSTGRNDFNGPVRWVGNYGYYEARLKFSGGKGIWPAFWLLPADHGWPPEIDIMELFGSDPHRVLMTYHWKDADGQPHKSEGDYVGPDFTQDWHVFAVNWQPQQIDWYIDGVLRRSLHADTITDTSMEMILNLAVGGIPPGNPDASTKFPATFNVDYVHVYSLVRKI